MATSTDSRLLIEENVPLAPLTSLGIGGPARFFVSVSTVDELREALTYARERRFPFCILGGGTNVLVSDGGFLGLVIKIALTGIRNEGSMIIAQAGTELGRVVSFAAECGLTGLEQLAGIPGTLGGAVRGNAGAYGFAVGDVAEEVLALNSETLHMLAFPRKECKFGYRSSAFKEDAFMVVVSAKLALSPGNSKEIRKFTEEIISRRGNILQFEKSAGSFFINPVVENEALVKKFEQERNVVCRKCSIPAGWIIEQAGFRGKRSGGAMVSELHANYIINTGNATAEDVLRLAGLIKEGVREKLGVRLTEEVNLIGFAD